MQIMGCTLMPYNARPPKSLEAWLTHESVLSDKLRAMRGEAKLLRLTQQWVWSSWWEKQVLSLDKSMLLLREIIMQSQGEPCWYARTFIPQQCYDSSPALFARLDTEPLGNLIFHTEGVKRHFLGHYAIDSSCIEYYWVKKHIPSLPERLWVRFSEVKVNETASFYLIEILLPALEVLP
jgi:chorismate--pyruvate lyase